MAVANFTAIIYWYKMFLKWLGEFSNFKQIFNHPFYALENTVKSISRSEKQRQKYEFYGWFYYLMGPKINSEWKVKFNFLYHQSHQLAELVQFCKITIECMLLKVCRLCLSILAAPKANHYILQPNA